MKQTFTLLLICCCSILFGQSLTLNTNEINMDLNGYVDYGAVTLTNNSTAAIEIAVRLEKTCSIEGDGTQIQVCIGDACYIPVAETTIWGDDVTQTPILVIEAGQTVDDALKFTALNCTFGSEWEVIFFDRNDTTSDATLGAFVAECTDVVSTIDLSLDVQKAFPNPANNYITIPYHLNRTVDANLQIFNAQGIRLHNVSISPNGNVEVIDISEFQNGIYFYQITDGKKVSRTLSFVK